MAAEVYEVIQYAASCRECRWYGDVYDNTVGEQLAEEDRTQHNTIHHPQLRNP